jgi:hypothetical protein
MDFSNCGSHTFTNWFTIDVHHPSSPFGHYKKLDERKRGIKIKCVAICPKEIGNHTICQGSHNPNVLCQPLECDYNECKTTPTLWSSKDWKHLPICIGALIFCQTMGYRTRSHVSECYLEMGHNKNQTRNASFMLWGS